MTESNTYDLEENIKRLLFLKDMKENEIYVSMAIDIITALRSLKKELDVKNFEKPILILLMYSIADMVSMEPVIHLIDKENVKTFLSMIPPPYSERFQIKTTKNCTLYLLLEENRGIDYAIKKAKLEKEIDRILFILVSTQEIIEKMKKSGKTPLHIIEKEELKQESLIQQKESIEEAIENLKKISDMDFSHPPCCQTCNHLQKNNSVEEHLKHE